MIVPHVAVVAIIKVLAHNNLLVIDHLWGCLRVHMDSFAFLTGWRKHVMLASL